MRELTVLVAVWVLLARTTGRKPAWYTRSHLWGWALPFVYLLTLAYHIYEAVVRSVYQMEPNFANQYRFIVVHPASAFWPSMWSCPRASCDPG